MSTRGIPDDFLRSSAAERAAPFVRALEHALAPGPNVRIGPWQLTREIGRGGMGTVFLAERADEQYSLRVALKVVRGALARGDQLGTRFREERQILATLEHPGIVRLLDGGVTEGGLPWYAMEYVAGVPVTQHIASTQLSVRDRLELFAAICDAVQYAHRKFVVHRDLKPSNVLVTGDGRPKLVDFGVARLLNEPVRNMVHSEQATPAYASKEQLRGDPINVTDDVYSLGVILHELLTGVRPVQTPTTPLRGDLAAIVATATADNPAARYASVEALAGDIARHLHNEPISVRHDDRTYRARRFILRNRIGVVATTVAITSLISGLTFSLIQARRADQQRDAAAGAAVHSEQISSFLTRLLYLADPTKSVGVTISVAQAIDSASAWLDREDTLAPEAHASLLLVFAEVYGATGNLERHRTFADSALAMQERIWGHNDPRLAGALGSMVESRWGTPLMAQSEPLLRRMIHLASQDSANGVFSLVHARNLLAISLRDQGRLAEAETELRRILAERTSLEVIYPVGVDNALNNLGHIQLAAHRPAEAAESYREVLQRRQRRWGDVHPEVANALVNLAQALGQNGHYAASDSLYRDGLDMRRNTQGANHPEIGVDMVGRGDILRLAGDSVEASLVYLEAARRLRATHGADHAFTRAAEEKGRAKH